MANLDLSFRAQSLDNQFPDPAEVNDRHLTKEDVSERQELAEKISKISLHGTRVFSEGLHNGFLQGDKFLLETPSDQLDVGDINAPILCYGRLPDKPTVSWSEDVVNALVDFAERIGRTVLDERQKMARRSVEAILEAQRRKQLRLRRKMLGVAALLIVLVILSILIAIEIWRKAHDR